MHPTITLILLISPVLLAIFLVFFIEELRERKLKKNAHDYLNILLSGIISIKVKGNCLSEESILSIERALKQLPRHYLIRNVLKRLAKYKKKCIRATNLVRYEDTVVLILLYLSVMSFLNPRLSQIIRKNIGLLMERKIDKFVNEIILSSTLIL